MLLMKPEGSPATSATPDASPPIVYMPCGCVPTRTLGNVAYCATHDIVCGTIIPRSVPFTREDVARAIESEGQVAATLLRRTTRSVRDVNLDASPRLLRDWADAIELMTTA